MKSGTLVILCAALSFSSCQEKEDAALKAEYEAQNEEITDLEFQINRINKKITENHIKDPTKQIEALNSKLEEIEQQKQGLLDEIAAAKAETKKATDKLEQYKSNYPIKAQ